MDEPTSGIKTIPTDDWKSFLPGAKSNPPAPSTNEERIPVPPIPKMGSSLNAPSAAPLNIQTNIKLPDAPIPKPGPETLPPLEKIGLTPKPPKTPPAPPLPKAKQEISEIPIPPAPKIESRVEQKPVIDLRTVKTFSDDILIAEGRSPEEHNINYDKVSSDEDVNKFLKPKIAANTPPSTNFNIKTPTGVYTETSTPLPKAEETITKGPLPPIRKTIVPPAPTPTFNPKRFGSIGQIENNETKQDIKQTSLSQLRTLKDDVNQVIQQKNITLASIAIKEDEKRRSEAQSVVKSGTSPKIIVLIVILLLAVSSGAIWFTFYRNKTPDTVVIDDTQKTNDVIFTDSDEIVEVSSLKDGELSAILKNELEKELPSGQVKTIRLINTVKNSEGKILIKEIPSVRILFSLLNLKADDRLVRLLSNNYMLGIYRATNESPFLILEADDYSTVFAQMLVWEEKGFVQNAYEGLTGEKLAEDLKGSWEDVVIENLDARVFKSEEGNPILYWAFIDRVKTLVITRDKDALIEVRTRFQTRTVVK